MKSQTVRSVLGVPNKDLGQRVQESLSTGATPALTRHRQGESPAKAGVTPTGAGALENTPGDVYTPLTKDLHSVFYSV